MTIALLVYALCALTAFACSVLLFAAWRRSRSGMLFWSGVCFLLLTFANAAVIADKFVLDTPLWPLRLGLGLAGVCALLYGLIFEER